MTEARSYHSPLREQQARLTAEQIMQSLVELAAAPDFDGLSIKALATRAGVAERTVYRHFPDRQSLLDALADHATRATGAEIGTEPDFGLPALPEVPDTVQETFRRFDLAADETTAAARLNAGGTTGTATAARGRRLTDLVAEQFPDLPDQDRQGVAALLHVICSSRSWLRMREGFDLPGEASGRYVAWLIHLMLADLEGRDRIVEKGDDPTA